MLPAAAAHRRCFSPHLVTRDPGGRRVRVRLFDVLRLAAPAVTLKTGGRQLAKRDNVTRGAVLSAREGARRFRRLRHVRHSYDLRHAAR